MIQGEGGFFTPMQSECFPGVIYARDSFGVHDGGEGDALMHQRNVTRPPTREEFVMPDVIIGLAVGLSIGEEGS